MTGSFGNRWATASITPFVAVPTGIFIAFWLALALNRKMRGIIFFRTIYFLPQITLTVAAATIWRWIYQPEIGMINHMLDWFGIDGPKWIHDTQWAMPSVIIMSNWQGIGFAMLICWRVCKASRKNTTKRPRLTAPAAGSACAYVTCPC